MKKLIVTTTIYKISKALKEYVKKKDWDIIIVGDKKTPHEDYKMLEKNNENVKYLDIEYQERNYKELSDLLGWNTIQRRNIGYLEALKNDYDIIASIDDDNIPLDNWGTNLLLGKEIEVYYYETDALCFDAIGVTNYKNLWHRGYPIQELHDRNKNYKITRKTIKVDVQADFWNGDPDIDAVCRLEHKPMCFFDNKYFPLATNAFSPFNSQNTFFTKEALKKYMVIPFIGRMDDIWGGYYLESLGFNVVYNKASVFQDRNIQNLTKNMVNEYIGYEKTLELLEELKKNSENIYNLLPEKTKECLLYYLNNN